MLSSGPISFSSCKSQGTGLASGTRTWYRSLLKLVESTCLAEFMNRRAEMSLYKIQFSKALKLHLDALLNPCSSGPPAPGTQALGITSHFQLPLLASLLEEPLLTAGIASCLPNFSHCEFICEGTMSGMEGMICSYYWQPVTAVMCCMLTACSAPQSAWDGRRASAKEPAICAQAGRSGEAPCQQHCPKASQQQSRRAAHSFGPPPGHPEPCPVLTSGLVVQSAPKRPCKVCLLYVLAEAEPGFGPVAMG